MKFEYKTSLPLPFKPPFNPTTIGDHIRIKRLERKLLQKDIGELIDVSEDCITNWENNRNEPQIHYIPKIIDFLGYVPIEVDATTLSGKITLCRYLHGLTYKQLGKLLNVDGSTVRSWELQQFFPSKSTMDRVWKWFSKNLKAKI